MAIPSFIFGGDTGETPDSIKRKREMVQALMSAQRAPRNVGEGLNALGDGIVSAVLDSRANAGEKAGQESANAAFGNIAGAMAGPSAFPAAPGASSASTAPQTANAQAIRAGLIERGLPEHVADGFLMNFQDESGLNPGINEKDPLVPGSRGGFGLYQLTGPRRVAYERFAADRGVAPSDTDAQLDFLMTELQGPEAKAAQSILASKDAGSAATAIARDFLRPAKQHLDSRVARYMQGAGSSDPVQVASLDQSVGLPEAPSPRQNVVNAIQQAASPQQQANPQIAQALVGGDKLPVTAGGTGGAIEYGPQGGPSVQMLMNAAGNQFMNDNQRSIVNALIGQQIEASDPMRQLQMRKLQQELNATPERKTVTINGRLVDAQTGQEIANFPEQPKAPEDPTDVREYKFYVDQEKAANREPIPFNDWQLQGKRAGATTVTVGGEPADGALRKKLDEKTGELWSSYQQTGATSAATAQDMQVLDELIKVAPQGPITGRLAELFPGVSSAGDAFQSIVKRIAPTLRAPGSGATSDIEYDGMLRSLPALRNRPEANAAISQIMKAKAAINVERSGIVDAYGRGEISAGEARNKIAELDKRSILTPELSQAIGDLGGEGGGPMQGAVVDGYRFKGGDPADPNSWEQVQ